MTKLFLCSGLSIILFMSVITGIRLLGDQLDSTAKHVLGPDSSELPQACWYGLCPGQQTFAQSVNDLTKIAAQQGATITDKFTAATDSHVFQYVACGEYLYPVWQSCVRSMFGPDYSYKNDAQIDLFLNEAGLHLGDIVALMGSPDSVRSCVGVLVHGLPEGQEALTIKLDYANGIVVSAYSVYDTLSGVPLLKWVITPEMRISSITYYLAPPMGLDDELKIPWRGFTMGPALDYFCPR